MDVVPHVWKHLLLLLLVIGLRARVVNILLQFDLSSHLVLLVVGIRRLLG